MPNSNLNAGEVSQAKAWLSDIYVLADEMQRLDLQIINMAIIG